MSTVTSEQFAARFPAVAEAVGPDVVEGLLSTLQLQEVAAGEALIAEGTVTDALFLVWDGELDVSMDTPDGPRKVGEVGRGAFLGEVSLLDPGPATGTVVSEQGCTVLRLDRAAFDDFCSRQPGPAAGFLASVLGVLAERVNDADARLDELLPAGQSSSGTLPGSTDRLVGIHSALYEH